MDGVSWMVSFHMFGRLLSYLKLVFHFRGSITFRDSYPPPPHACVAGAGLVVCFCDGSAAYFVLRV